MQKNLIKAGTVLLLIGLILGTILDWFASPAVAADAHVAGVQHGMLLMILGLAWKFTKLDRLAVFCCSLNVLGLYGIWTAFLVGAIAGDPYPSASTVTYVMFVVSSGILIVGIGLFLYGLFQDTDA
jgi:hypothetical protein